MLARVKLFCLHGVLHLVFHSVPRVVHTLLVKLPVTLFELITFRRPFTYSSERARRIEVVSNAKDERAGAKLRNLFGVHDDMRYDGPLYSGHVHTVLGAARLPERVDFDRELMDAEDGNPICLDWLRVPHARADEVKGVILVVPGLGNYGQTPYMQRLVREAVRRGYHCCVLTPRGMGSAPLKTPNITCVTFSGDAARTIRHKFTKEEIRKHCYGRDLPMFLLAYSAGANTMLKALCEEWTAHERSGGQLYKGDFPVTAAVSMVGPTSLAVAAAQLRTTVGQYLYAGPILVALKKYLSKHKEALLKASEGKTEEEKRDMALIHVDFKAAMAQIKDPRDIDIHVVAKHFDFKDEQDYYAHGYAPDFIKATTGVPILYLVSRDDPTTGYPVGLRQWQELCNQQKNVVYVETPSGGHLGFVKNPFQEYSHPVSFLQSFPLDRMDAVVDCIQHGKRD